MSWEVWGTPPDPEPVYCPMCDQESHHPDCELGKMQARAIRAEDLVRELLAALIEERKIRLLGQEPDVHLESKRDLRRACYAATDDAIAKATGG